MNLSLKRLTGFSAAYPPEHRQNIIHLLFDITWWGVLNGSTLVFLAVYASRIGASPLQIGLLTAAPAMMNLIFTFPASNLAIGRPIHKLVRNAAMTTRMFYALLVPLPFLFGDSSKIWIIIAITFLMNVSGTVAAVLGNAFFAETVPIEFRGSVVGVRNALLAVTSMITTFAAGQILTRLPFASGYAIIFALGWIGAMMSVFHLFLIKPVPSATSPVTPAAPISKTRTIRLEILKGPFLSVLALMFFFHFAIFLPNPVFPLYQVRVLKMTDEIISLGTSLFYVIHFLTSLQVGRLSRKFSFKQMTGIGTLFTAAASLIFTFSYQTWIFLFCQLFSGIAWGMIGGGLLNYLLVKMPENDRPAYLAWFNIAVNLATLICGLIASPVAGVLGLFGTLLLAVILRALAGLAILRWG
ncbi:MAG: MFS transporter [Anaerolineae bacterium]|nr:MFS transporter [Anaerolineae bacterium]